jgi:hypothetical protein
MTPEDCEVFLAQFREPARARATVRYYRNLLWREIPLLLAGKYRWSRLEVPTLVLSGDRDPLLPASQMSGFGSHATDLRVELIERVGHFPATEDPDWVVRRALSFFADAHPPAGTDRGVRDTRRFYERHGHTNDEAPLAARPAGDTGSNPETAVER